MRSRPISRACLLLCFAALLGFAPAAPAQAQNFSRHRQAAEQAPQRRSFWDRLFGRHKQYEAARPAPAAAAPRRPAAAPKAAAKNANARRVLVIGDAAAALADGLTAAYNDNPNIVIRAKTAAAQVTDQAANIRALAMQEKPNLIIIMPGAAEQAQMAALLPALQKIRAAWVWVGLPPFKNTELNSKAQALNRLYQQAAENAGGRFVSIWEGFIDDKGNFAFSGYDVNGIMARLRTADGIGFTPAGRRKLAFYASQAIDLLWGNDDERGQPLNSAGGGKVINARAAPVNPLDIGADDAALAGGRPAPGEAAAANPPAEGAAAGGNSVPPGRADNFRFVPQ